MLCPPYRCERTRVTTGHRMTKSTPQRAAQSDTSGRQLHHPTWSLLHSTQHRRKKTEHDEHDLARCLHVRPVHLVMATLLTLAPTHRRYNKYAQITARAVRQSLQETERVGAEKRGTTLLRYQKWEDGVGGQHVIIFPPSPLVVAQLESPCRSPSTLRKPSRREKRSSKLV